MATVEGIRKIADIWIAQATEAAQRVYDVMVRDGGTLPHQSIIDLGDANARAKAGRHILTVLEGVEEITHQNVGGIREHISNMMHGHIHSNGHRETILGLSYMIEAIRP